jgi:hypothetical protein
VGEHHKPVRATYERSQRDETGARLEEPPAAEAGVLASVRDVFVAESRASNTGLSSILVRTRGSGLTQLLTAIAAGLTTTNPPANRHRAR